MSFITSVTASFGANTSELRRGAQEGEGIISRFANSARESIGEIAAGFLKSFAIVEIIERLKDMAVEAFENAERLKNLSRELTVSTNALQSFNFVVKETGGSSDAAQKGWEHLRLALDQLAEGNASVTDSFAKLGLAATDFQGLSLDESLEKLSKAYEENKESSGSYNAIAEILGKRTAPQLMVALQELAEKGFAGVNENARKFGQVVRPDSIDVLTYTVKGLGAAWGWVKTQVAEGTANTIRLGESIDALITGDLAALKEIWASRNAEIAESEKKIGEQQKANNEGLREGTAELGKHKASTDDILIGYDRLERSIINTSRGQEKLAALAAEFTSLLLTAGSSSRTIEERTAAAAEAEKVKVEYEKYAAELKEKEAIAAAKASEEEQKQARAAADYVDKVNAAYNKAKFDALPIEERINYLTDQRNALLADMARRDKESVTYKQDFIDLQRTDADLTSLAVSAEKQRTDEIAKQVDEKAKLNNLSGSGSPLGLHNLGNFSTASLQAELEYLQKQMAGIVLEYQQKGYTGNPYTDNYYLQSEIQSVKDELAFRAGFTSAYSKGGTAAALQYYTGRGGDPLYFDRAMGNMGSWGQGLDTLGNLAKQTNDSLAQITQQLKKLSGG